MSVTSKRLLSSSSMATFLLRTLFVSFQIKRCLLTWAKCINSDYLAERDFMLSLPDENQADAIETFNSTTRYQDHLLNTDTECFEQIVDQIYYIELQFNGAKSSDTESTFFYWIYWYNVSTSIFSNKLQQKWWLLVWQFTFPFKMVL